MARCCHFVEVDSNPETPPIVFDALFKCPSCSEKIPAQDILWFSREQTDLFAFLKLTGSVQTVVSQVEKSSMDLWRAPQSSVEARAIGKDKLMDMVRYYNLDVRKCWLSEEHVEMFTLPEQSSEKRTISYCHIIPHRPRYAVLPWEDKDDFALNAPPNILMLNEVVDTAMNDKKVALFALWSPKDAGFRRYRVVVMDLISNDQLANPELVMDPHGAAAGVNEAATKEKALNEDEKKDDMGELWALHGRDVSFPKDRAPFHRSLSLHLGAVLRHRKDDRFFLSAVDLSDRDKMSLKNGQSRFRQAFPPPSTVSTTFSNQQAVANLLQKVGFSFECIRVLQEHPYNLVSVYALHSCLEAQQGDSFFVWVREVEPVEKNDEMLKHMISNLMEMATMAAEAQKAKEQAQEQAKQHDREIKQHEREMKQHEREMERLRNEMERLRNEMERLDLEMEVAKRTQQVRDLTSEFRT